MYSGIGQISTILSRLGYHVSAVEENSHAVSDAKDNLIANGASDNVTVYRSRVEDIVKSLSEPDVIIVNPSRSGLHLQVRQFISQQLRAKPVMLYISCDINSFVRDLSELVAAGYSVRQLEAFDMFPNTNKLEWLALLA